MPKVSIIIVNWNGWRDTIECLKSLQAINYPNFEVILVDNGSTDDSISNLKPITSVLKYKATLIEIGKNLGFSGGNNIGIKYALENNADYLLFLNNDTAVEPEFLKKLIKTGESDAKIGIIGPKIYYFDEPNRIWSAGGNMNWFGGNTQLGGDQVETELPQNIMPKNIELVSGCAMLIKKEVLEKTRFLYEPYFLYYEDVDFCLRARKAGYGCVIVFDAKIWHKISRSTIKFGKPIFHYYNHRNILLCAKRNRPIFFYFIMIPWSFWKFGKQLIKLILKPNQKPISLAIINGIIDFYKGNFGKKHD